MSETDPCQEATRQHVTERGAVESWGRWGWLGGIGHTGVVGSLFQQRGQQLQRWDGRRVWGNMKIKQYVGLGT